MVNRYIDYEIKKLMQVEGEGLRALLELPTGECREAAIMVSRNRFDNSLNINIVPHYTDPDSTKWFQNTMPWKHEELKKEG